MRGFVRGRYRAAFTHVGGMVSGKENGLALGVVIALGVQFLMRTRGGDGAKAFDPLAISRHRVDPCQRLALRDKGPTLGHIRLAALPTQRGFAAVEKTLGVVKGGHGFSLKKNINTPI